MINNNLFTWRIVFRLSATFMFALFVMASCKKKDTSLGVNSIDQNEILNSSQIDTFSIHTYTEGEDSVVTSNPAAALLGSYNDPKFGPCEASFFTQVRLASVNPAFGTADIIIDSFVLGLQYSGFYGDLSDQNIEVYQLTDSLGLNTTYYSFSNKSYSSTNLVDPNHDIDIDPYTKTVIDTTHVAAQMRIYLDTNLARTLITEALTNATTFASNENFLNYFKGLHVKVNNPPQAEGVGGILYFDINTPLSKLTIYYRQSGTKKTYDFVMNAACADFTKVDINNSGKPVANVMNNHSLGQNQFYSQAMKTRAVISIPGVDDIPKKSIIHEAKLILPVDYQTGYKYGPGYQISLSTKLDDGTTGLYSIGVGDYDPIGKQFTFDLKSYVQALVSGQRFPVTISGTTVDVLIKGTELRINPRYFNTSVDRIIFNGSNTINKNKPKLILKYTEF